VHVLRGHRRSQYDADGAGTGEVAEEVQGVKWYGAYCERCGWIGTVRLEADAERKARQHTRRHGPAHAAVVTQEEVIS